MYCIQLVVYNYMVAQINCISVFTVISLPENKCLHLKVHRAAY